MNNLISRHTSQDPDDGCKVDDASVTPSSIILTATHCLTEHPDQQNDDQDHADNLQDNCNDRNGTA